MTKHEERKGKDQTYIKDRKEKTNTCDRHKKRTEREDIRERKKRVTHVIL